MRYRSALSVLAIVLLVTPLAAQGRRDGKPGAKPAIPPVVARLAAAGLFATVLAGAARRHARDTARIRRDG